MLESTIHINIQQIIISSYHASNNCQIGFQPTRVWLDGHSRECVLKVRAILHDTDVKKFIMYPKYFCCLLKTLSIICERMYVNIFELVCVFPFPTSGVTSSMCLFFTQLSFCLWLKISLKFQRIFLVF